MPRKREPLNEKEIKLILTLYRSALSTVEIGKALKIRPVTASNIIKERGIWIPRRNKEYKYNLSDEDIGEAFSKFKTIRKTAKELGLDQPRVKVALQRLGLTEITYREKEESLEKYKDEIIEMHNDKYVSRDEILEKFGINRTTLRRVLEKWGAFKKQKVAKKPLKNYGVTEESLIQKFLETKSIAQTAEVFGMTTAATSKFLKENGFEVDIHEKKRKIVEDKDSIIIRYVNNRETANEIAKDYGVYNSTILDYLERWGIPRESRNISNLRDLLNDNKENIFKMFSEGYTAEEIGKTIGKKRQHISKFLKENGYVLENQRRKESSLERRFKYILDDLGINYEQHYEVNRRYYDFYIPKYQLLIEINGDYWHCNPRAKNITITPEALAGPKRDIIKFNMAKALDFQIIFIWELEINEKPSKVINLLKDLKNKIPVQSSPTDFLTDREEYQN